MPTFEIRAQRRFEEQTERFEASTQKDKFWTTFELDQYELIKRDRRLSKTFNPSK